MKRVDLLWYRRDDLTRAGHNVDAPRSFHSARANMLRELRQRGLTVRLVLPHMIGEWSGRPRWDEDLRLIPMLGVGRAASVVHRLILAAYFGWWMVARRPRVILTDVDGVISAVPWSILTKVLGRGPRFCLDVRSVPVEESGAAEAPATWQRRRGYRISLWLASKFLHQTTFITEGLRDSVAANYGVHFSAVGFWSSGVDPDLFCPNRPRPGNGDAGFTVMYHGEISPNRGLDDLIAAVGLASRRIEKLRLVILGASRNQRCAAALLDQLEALAVEVGVADRVQFVPPVEHRRVPEFINQVDVGVVPWKDRPWWRGQSPLKLLEYLSCGLPVVATDIDATRRVIGDSMCGVYCRPDHPADMARAIVDLYEEKASRPAHFQERGRVGRSLIMSEYTWKMQANRLIECLALSGQR